MQETGVGNLFRQFELLKNRLNAEGLFDLKRKRKLPTFPLMIGIVTSSKGAALHDILTTLAHRFPVASVKVYASEVQGSNAPCQLISAIDKANQDNLVEVLILARGGGSLEDLWAFNDEGLARAISQSTIPIVSGIGHETDFTIADFVADLRAATPTAAAVAATPNKLELIDRVKILKAKLLALISSDLKNKKLVLEYCLAKLVAPKRELLHHWQALDYLESKIKQNAKQIHQSKQHNFIMLLARFKAIKFELLIQHQSTTLKNLEARLKFNMQMLIEKYKTALKQNLKTMHDVSPLATLGRGYAIASLNGVVLSDVAELRRGERIDVKLLRGSLCCEVIDLFC